MKSYLLFGALLVSTGSFLFSTPITNNVTGPNSYARLSMDSGLNYVSASGSSFAAGLDFVHPSPGPNGAASSLAFSQQLTTMGPARPGFMRVTVDGGGGGNGAYTGGSVAFFGAPGAIDPIANDSCGASPSYPCTVPEAHYAHNLLNFELGVPYTFAFSETASAYTESDGEGTYADYFMNYSYQLWEADGLTPVTVMSAAPEPGTLGLLGFSVGLVALFRKSLRK